MPRTHQPRDPARSAAPPGRLLPSPGRGRLAALAVRTGSAALAASAARIGPTSPAALLGWIPLVALIGLQIAYPLATGAGRAGLVLATVAVGYAFSVGHALVTRGMRVGIALVVVTTGGGLAVEMFGVATGAPFGQYVYGDGIGPKLAGVPLIIPLAWTWMAWPAWLAATRLAGTPAIRIGLAGLGLAAWDLFLDPQMVAEGYWHWAHPVPGLPGVSGVPLTNYAGWLAVSVLLMLAFAGLAGLAEHARPAEPSAAGPPPATGARRTLPVTDAPMLALYLWTYYSSVLAHAVFLGLPASALWGGAGMGLVTVPLSVWLLRTGRRRWWARLGPGGR